MKSSSASSHLVPDVRTTSVLVTSSASSAPFRGTSDGTSLPGRGSDLEIGSVVGTGVLPRPGDEHGAAEATLVAITLLRRRAGRRGIYTRKAVPGTRDMVRDVIATSDGVHAATANAGACAPKGALSAAVAASPARSSAESLRRVVACGDGSRPKSRLIGASTRDRSLANGSRAPSPRITAASAARRQARPISAGDGAQSRSSGWPLCTIGLVARRAEDPRARGRRRPHLPRVRTCARRVGGGRFHTTLPAAALLRCGPAAHRPARADASAGL
jgi:hypothetical protein